MAQSRGKCIAGESTTRPEIREYDASTAPEGRYSPKLHFERPENIRHTHQSDPHQRDPSVTSISVVGTDLHYGNRRPEDVDTPLIPPLVGFGIAESTFRPTTGSPQLPSIAHLISSIGDRNIEYHEFKPAGGNTLSSSASPVDSMQNDVSVESDPNKDLCTGNSGELIDDFGNTGCRRFRCPRTDCEWSFVRLSDYKRHLRTHGERLLHCPFRKVDASCFRKGGTFNRLDVLKRHLKLVHFSRFQTSNGEAGWCRVCGRHFGDIKQFLSHAEECAAEALEKLNAVNTAKS